LTQIFVYYRDLEKLRIGYFSQITSLRIGDMPSQHVLLFHHRSLMNLLQGFSFPPDLKRRHALMLPWIEQLRYGRLDKEKEMSLHGEFLVRVFGDVLGYKGFSQADSDGYELKAEKTVGPKGKSCDGAIGFFGRSGKAHVIAPIELKGAKQGLDQPQGRRFTPVEQAWDYANQSPRESRWIIVSNYRETRLYSSTRGASFYEAAFLEKLSELDEFKRFYLMFSRESLLPTAPGSSSIIDELLVASANAEAEITDALYQEYKELRKNLFKHLCRVHSNLPPLDLLKYTQTILDRILFIVFAEDRGLLPPTTITDAYDHRDKYNPRPIWQNFLAVFQWINSGNKDHGIPAYNGGLFRQNEWINDLEVSDAMCAEFKNLARYDFGEDVSVDVLGHVFEQSITDLEQMRAEADGSNKPRKLSKRKAEGVFYTPPYITRFIVDQTLGKALKEKWEAAVDAHRPEKQRGAKKRKQAWKATWESYRDALKDTRVLDPACGSGAFLIAAFDTLSREYEKVNSALAELRGGQIELFDLTTTILNNNLFGVDLNAESVEITKLSLWLKTAERKEKLTYLDRNIKCGNSIISDNLIHPLAFDWGTGRLACSVIDAPVSEEDEAIDSRWREGFDVVIGNPPYVRQELLKPYKKHLRTSFQSYHGVADLFVYFFERGLSVLTHGGRLGFICSSSWLRSNYATPLRGLLRRRFSVETIVDLGDNRVFSEAPDVYPSITVISARTPPEQHSALAAQFVRGERVIEFTKQLSDKLTPISIDDQEDSGWQIGGAVFRRLLDKVLAQGRSLSEVAGGKFYRGVLTGLNNAFIIDQKTRDALIREDPACAPLLKKMLRGADLRPWYQEDEGRWLIFTRHGTDIDLFPTIKAHLEQFRASLEPRPHDWPAHRPWPGRKPGKYKWFEIQDSVAYFEEFERPKIFWPNICKIPRFSWDREGKYINDKGYIIPIDDPSLLAILQSRVTWFVISQICTPLGQRAGLFRYQLFTQFTSRLPVPAINIQDRNALLGLAMKTTDRARDRYILHEKTRNRIISDLVPPGKKLNKKLTSWWNLDFRTFRGEIRKVSKQDIPVADRDDWEELLACRLVEHDRLTAKIIAKETEINDRVYRLFNLDKDEIRLVEETTKYPYGEV